MRGRPQHEGAGLLPIETQVTDMRRSLLIAAAVAVAVAVAEAVAVAHARECAYDDVVQDGVWTMGDCTALKIELKKIGQDGAKALAKSLEGNSALCVQNPCKFALNVCLDSCNRLACSPHTGVPCGFGTPTLATRVLQLLRPS